MWGAHYRMEMEEIAANREKQIDKIQQTLQKLVEKYERKGHVQSCEHIQQCLSMLHTVKENLIL